jgi:hypothetical protein
MSKVLFGVAFAALSVIGLAAAPANAGHVVKKTTVVHNNGYRHNHYNNYNHRNYNHNHQRTVVVTKTYYRDHGVRFKGGYYFSGQHHNHWAHKSWNVKFNRYHYYEPTLQVYYYYCPDQDAYYPCD